MQMFSTFTLLTLGGTAFRMALNWGLKTHTNHSLNIPQILAGGLIVLAGLPELIKPFPYPLPLSFTLGFLLPDLLLRRNPA
ncbi:hypothetical protein AB9F29_02720 [Falsihalocynthiibacter sp. S25ZX9]|uniref:hypothetical protein n=1 Tax=Falsihalocynthiibacter sp. S25ZX9 TaxID=3240870 RepID=UPI0035108654